ncbi:hypothetical protein BC827DRAFT_353434 [Russula dissimulans]|jgi:hypothetical protein|nr:hypothetical protein BC827DRAFT_353434 [Russula dissimulans]
MSHPQTPTNSNKVFGFPLVISNDRLTCIDHGDHQPEEGGLVNVPSIQGHQSTQSDTTSTSSNSERSEPSIPSGIFCAPVIIQYQEQRASRGLPKQLQKHCNGKGKGPIVLSSRSSRRPAGARGLGARNGPYLCDVCGKAYTQRQGVARHRRETHDARLCSYCGIFKWGRRYLYKKHLQTKHSDEATGSGRM